MITRFLSHDVINYNFYCYFRIFTIETSMVVMSVHYFSIANDYYFSAKVMARTFKNTNC